MPKGGKKKKGKKKNKNLTTTKRQLELRDLEEEYARIENMLGDRRVEARLTDGSVRMCIIPGRFRKRCWMAAGDVILVTIRSYQEDKCDIIHKYNSDEVHRLVGMGEIPGSFLNTNAKNAEEEEEETGFQFDIDEI